MATEVDFVRPSHLLIYLVAMEFILLIVVYYVHKVGTRYRWYIQILYFPLIGAQSR